MIGKHLRISLLAVLALFGLGACGGSETTAGGGIGGTGISYGTVTDFGSVWVNGVEFNTNGATIVKDDVGISESELRIGMTVEVRGTIDYATPTGVATTVTVKEAVRGPVEQAPTGTASAGTLVVLGQTVNVDDTTFIDDNVCAPGTCSTPSDRFNAISAGDVLEVHGLRRADGSIVATFIEAKTDPVIFSVRGTIAAHSAAAETFTIGGLNVSYAGATVNDMPAPGGSNWDGLFVEVKGQTCTGGVPPACGALLADKVEPEGLAVADAARAEIEGFVTSGTAADFTIGNQRVVTNGATVFAGGLPEEIVVGTKLEVEGTLAGGVLTATKVKFKDNVKLESNATASASTIMLEGLPGIMVTANQFTEFKGTTAMAADLSPLDGQNVRIRGRASGPNSVIATEIEDRGPVDPNSDVVLQGFVKGSDVSDPTLIILGVEVDTTGLADIHFEGVNDAPIGRAAFFSTLTGNGGLVKAKGRLPATNALASGSLEEIELED